MTNFAPFDSADYLTGEKTIAEYLSASLEDPNPAAVRADPETINLPEGGHGVTKQVPVPDAQKV